ncbi:hypothetical protein Hanom_Chr03g00252511 [Helianthus anomalus]
MPVIPWSIEENIALCESCVVALTNHEAVLPISSFWDRVYHEFCIRRGEAIRRVDTLCSRFRMIHMDSARFAAIVNGVDTDDGELNEGDIIQVACVEYHNRYGGDFKHYVAWQIIPFFWQIINHKVLII